MDEHIGIWNLLHDGEITAISHQSGTFEIFVSIPYLRRRIEPLGDSFVVTLSDVKQLDFRDFDGNIASIQQQLDIGNPEILGTDSSAMPVVVDTTLGQMIVDFSRLILALDTGQRIDYQSIDEAACSYWAEWEAKSPKTQRP